MLFVASVCFYVVGKGIPRRLFYSKRGVYFQKDTPSNY